MKLKRHKITARYKWHDFELSKVEDFTLEPDTAIDAEQIVLNPDLTLYSLDLEKREAVFTETPEIIDLETAAFMFRGQFENATHVVTLPFDVFHTLAASFNPDAKNIVFIHSVGRCGSTLISKAFQTLQTVRSLSEPDAFTLIALWKGSQSISESELQQLTESSLRFCSKPMRGKQDCTRWAIKFRSQCIEIAALMDKAFPESKHLYLTRDPLSWLESVLRVFVDAEKVEDPEYIELFEKGVSGIYPLVRNMLSAEGPMSVSKLWLLNWISNKETQQACKSKGIRFGEADFSEIKATPRETIERLFNYCGIDITDWAPIELVLSKDSQAGSSIERSKTQRGDRAFPEYTREEAVQLLAKRGHEC